MNKVGAYKVAAALLTAAAARELREQEARQQRQQLQDSHHYRTGGLKSMYQAMRAAVAPDAGAAVSKAVSDPVQAVMGDIQEDLHVAVSGGPDRRQGWGCHDWVDRYARAQKAR